jgi:hypothetical protein
MISGGGGGGGGGGDDDDDDDDDDNEGELFFWVASTPMTALIESLHKNNFFPSHQEFSQKFAINCILIVVRSTTNSADSPSIQWLDRSKVVHQVLVFLGQLLAKGHNLLQKTRIK